MSFDQNSSYSLFDALRPGVDTEVTHAVVATYSLDLVTLLGLVLALGGQADEEFETGPIGLIDTFRRMTGKLKVLCQKGRIVVPRRHHAVLTVLDSMVRQIATNERSASWHPKFAFVRYQGAKEANWRLWIGSRNLTGSRDLEAGLLLTSKAGGKRGAVLGDVADLAAAYIDHDILPPDILDELKRQRWVAPAGIKVNRIHWRIAGTTVPFLPTTTRPRPTLVISPFIDKVGLASASTFAGGPLSLLTTEDSAKKVVFPEQIDARVMGMPEPLGVDSSESQREPVQAEFQDISPPKGLHAKLFLQRRGSKSVLFVGSANLTRRGLIGPNAEVMAELEINDEKYAESLSNFFGFGRKAEKSDCVSSDEVAREALDKDVCDLMSVEVSLELNSSGLVLKAARGIDDFLARNTLFVQLLSLPASRSEWLPRMRSLTLYEGELAVRSQTAFVIFEATSKVDETVKRAWTQWISFPDLDIERRNRAAIAAYVGPGRFKDWLRSTLEGVLPTEAETWDGQPKIFVTQGVAKASDSIFALEYVLGRWARNPMEFERRIPEVNSMLLAFKEEIERGPDGAEKQAALNDLLEVESFWAAVSDAAGVGSP